MPNDEPDKVVRITLNGSGLPVPDQDPVPVKKDKQKVRWSADFDFKIDVEDYSDLKYSSGGGDYSCKTGYFTNVRPHKYSITANGQTNDPDLDIQP